MDKQPVLQQVLEGITEADLPDAVASLVDFAGGPSGVWTLEGPLGAGKTTLVKALCHHLGVQDTVSSPTFALVNEYLTEEEEPVYHFDFYRIKEEAEATAMGVEEYFDSGDLCLVEWPGRIPNLLPPEGVHIRIEPTDERTRTLTFTRYDS